MNLITNSLACVNFHFWSQCNFKCKYCFTHFTNISSILSKKECLEIIKKLAENDTAKINFVGGEPTLSPFLGELISYSKELFLKTSIVSNGIGITPEFIEQYGEYIDWIGLSLDSSNENVQMNLGRGIGSYVNDTINKSEMVKAAGIKLKINSVITYLNYAEDMTDLIELIKPDRWKIFQVLKIEGQNDRNIGKLLITESEFKEFVKRHEYLNPIVEDNDAMLESYIMIDPKGRFFQNTNNIYVYSRSIIDVGVLNALNDLEFNHAKFVERGGIYAW